MSEGEGESDSNVKEWKLDAETEYHLELDPGTSLAIKASYLEILNIWMSLTHGFDVLLRF